MNKVIIIADSTVDLTPELIKKHNIVTVPLIVRFDEEIYYDNETITPDELYEKVKIKGELPKTAAVAPQTFIDLFKPYIDQGCDILFSGIGAKMSSTIQNAIIASNEFPEGRIFILDSGNLSTGTGLLILKMCKYRDEGKSAKEIFDLVSPLVTKVSAQFAVDTLEYLHKGGRCSGASKIFGTIFHIHPIIKLVDGGMIVYKKPRGAYKAALNELVNEIKGDYPNVDLDHIFVTHSGMDQNLINYLYEEVSKVVGQDHVYITRAGCVISSHCGPGTIGVLYIKK
ncbi:MAG: DegV family protein [Bacilli bacterium]|nr:DegV family protein [Bacilli bacterium]